MSNSHVEQRNFSGFLIGSRIQKLYIFGGYDKSDFLEGLIDRYETPKVPISKSPRNNESSLRENIQTEKKGISHRFKTLKASVNSGSSSKQTRHAKGKSLDGSNKELPQVLNTIQATITNTSTTDNLQTSKKSYGAMMDHVEDLEEYTNTLCTDALHLISILTNEELKKDDYELLKSMCEELKIFCSTSQPVLFTDPTKKVKALEKQQKTQRFEKKNFPYQYYQSVKVAKEYNHPLPPNFSSWSKEKTSRYHIFNEIVQTETLYVHDLAYIISFYMKPLQNEFKDIINLYEFTSLFKNIESLFELNKQILSSLQEQQNKPCKQQDTGAVFLHFLDEIKSKYITYSANQIAANETYVSLMKSSPDFENFCNLVFSLPESKNQSLDSYLIKPFQRVCRYSLLLKELDKQTPNSWPTASNIHKAKKAIDIVVGKANESKREADSLVQVLEIQNRFDFGDPELMQLHKLHFIKEGVFKILNAKKKLKSITIFLFKENLLLANGTGKKLTKLRFMKTNCIIIYDIGDSSKSYKNVFTIVDISDNFKIDVSAPSLEDKKAWIEAINTADPSQDAC